MPPPHAPTGLHPALARLAAGQTLTASQAEAAFANVMAGAATSAQIGALLMALRSRGETDAELIGAAQAMRAHMIPVPLAQDAIDVCGTGGDQIGTLNISTAVAFVAAGAGIPVAKHGNRSASSRSGAADVLAALGVRLDPQLARLPDILRQAGCVFLFAPSHHAALRHAAVPRAELGTRTIFNLLGPLTNPAGVRRQLVGVFDPARCSQISRVLAALGSTDSWVVHGGGVDELTLAAPNHVVAQHGDHSRAFMLDAATLGLTPAPLDDILGGEAAENAECLLALLRTTPHTTPAAARRARAYRDTVLLNAAAALVVAGQTADLAAALVTARRALDSGAALDALDRLRAATQLHP